MRGDSRFSCCLIGQKSLLILCAEDLLARGHVIRAVATENDEVQKWAVGRGLPVVPSTSERLVSLLSDNACDYLFSVINYRVLPEHVLALPKKGAINFHDGSLPGYAGMYVTTWALINGEREHGISWHWMTKEIDAGGVLKEKRFSLSSDETAFTLNTKCYEAGFEAFRGLVTDLEHGATSCRSQVAHTAGGYYGLRKRPERMATLDWSRPAHELDALYRGLDFGRYENPIGCPKVLWGDQVLIPRRFILLEQPSTRPPGTLERRTDPNSVGVHTATKIVELGDFVTLDGRPFEIATEPSRRLDGKPPVELDQRLQQVCVHESYWAARLAAREPLALPYVPADIGRNQAPTNFVRRALDAAAIGESGNSSEFIARAVAAISLYLGRISGKETFDLDYQGSSQVSASSEAALSFATAMYFVNSVPMRVKLNWTSPFAEQVPNAAGTLAELEKRGTYARDLVLRYPQITEEHRQKLREVPDVVLAVRQHALNDILDVPPAQLAILISPKGRQIELVANADVFDAGLLTKIAGELAHVMAQVGAHPDLSLADVAVVAPAELAVLDGWNKETRTDYEPQSLPRLFEAQVERTPDATAIVFRGQTVSYRELNVRANRLANLLIARGVKRGDLVGVLMDRSVEMVASMYAVLKAGAGYIPMDPAYPSHRLAIMVEDASPSVILTQASRAEQLAAVAKQVVIVDQPDSTGAGDFSAESPGVGIQPDDVAYVMYTSGSTGRPKGVMITHRNIHNFFLTIDRKLTGDPPGTWLATTSISFDISIPELFWTLTRGAQVILRGSAKADRAAADAKPPSRPIDFSLVLRNVADRGESGRHEQNPLLARAAEFADEHGFAIYPACHTEANDKGPRPNPADLSSYVTADGHPDTFRCAARIGAFVSARLLEQCLESLAKNIALYRQTWKEAGHPGDGRVTLLVPTLVGQDETAAKEASRDPLKAYLEAERSLLRQAAWEFPAFQKIAEDGTQTLDQFLDSISQADFNALLGFAFERYYTTGGLFGNRSHCLATVERLKEIGVDEIACLVDFGLPADQVLRQLPELNELKLAANAEKTDEDPDDIATLIERHGVTHFQCTPSRAASLTWDPRIRQAMGNLKLMIVGGEAMSEELARQLRSIVPGRVFNVYGPTETTVWSTMQELAAINGPVPLGKPIANTQLYVVDERQRPLPVGVPGELLIGGDGVGRGYLNRPDLTQARFLQTDHGKLYRTGDLVRLRSDGVVEFLGRFDDQVKIRGHRIELGEIEAVLESEPSVQKAVVHPQDDAAGGKRLVAYVVFRSSTASSLDALRPFVSERLPEFMVPSLFEPLDDLPLTPSGKVDRRALPKPNFGQRRNGSATDRTPPRTPTERQMAELWQTLLEVRDVDRSDNFFELGGHSLLGMRAVSKIDETFGVRLSTKTFLVSSLAQVAAEIDRLKVDRQKEIEDERSHVAAAGLSRLPRWLISRMGGGSPRRAKNRG